MICLEIVINSDAPRCPFDWKIIQKHWLRPDFLVSDILDEYDVYCKNRANGCNYLNTRKMIVVHENICQKTKIPKMIIPQ